MSSEMKEKMTLDEVRAELKGAKGKKYWRSLDELANLDRNARRVEFLRARPGELREMRG